MPLLKIDNIETLGIPYVEPIKYTSYDPLDEIRKLTSSEQLGKLAEHVLEAHYKARRTAGDAFERGGWNNPDLPICQFTDKVIAASVATTILKLASEGYITINKDLKL